MAIAERMEPLLGISEEVQKLLRCPVCHATLQVAGQALDCIGPSCGACFPLVDGIPVLIDERSSVFSLDDFVSRRGTFFANVSGRESTLKKALRRCIPTIDNNVKAEENYIRLRELLLGQSTSPRVLVLGGGIPGEGMQILAGTKNIELVETDASFGPRTRLICDAHDI